MFSNALLLCSLCHSSLILNKLPFATCISNSLFNNDTISNICIYCNHIRSINIMSIRHLFIKLCSNHNLKYKEFRSYCRLLSQCTLYSKENYKLVLGPFRKKTFVFFIQNRVFYVRYCIRNSASNVIRLSFNLPDTIHI